MRQASSNHTHPYRVVLLARSGAVFPHGEGFKLEIQGEDGSVDLRASTRFDAMPTGHPLPREICFEANLTAAGLNDAIDKGRGPAAWFVPILAFAANAEVGDPVANLAYETTEHSNRREFVQFHYPEETGAPGRGRFIDDTHVTALVDAIEARGADSGRLWRSLAQYNFALRFWYRGGEFLALSHLWMAVETLLPLVIKDQRAEESKTLEELAQQRGIDTAAPKWRYHIEGALRREFIFQGDEVTHRLAKGASDGLEHGYGEADKIQGDAMEVCEKVFDYVRAAIVQRLRLPEPLGTAISAKAPIDTHSSTKSVHGYLCGHVPVDRLAISDELYPRYVWTTSIKEVVDRGDSYSVTLNETFSPRFGEGVSLEEGRLGASWRPTPQEREEFAANAGPETEK